MVVPFAILAVSSVVTVVAVRWLVIYGIEVICRKMGLSAKAKGQVIGYATSMPELVTSVIAASKGQSDLCVGNVVGSNLMNGLVILPVGALLAPISVPPLGLLDLVVSLILTASLIPVFIILRNLGWINTFYPLLLPRLGGQAFFIFMIIQFIRGIPIDLDEAALIDGCGKSGIFFRIILPQLKPAMITAAIFSFYWTWEDFMTPLIYMNDPELYTVSLALRTFADPSGQTDWGAIFAMMSLSLVPVFVIFIAFQRYLVEGISTTGLKG